jgi:hypothetical protein
LILNLSPSFLALSRMLCGSVVKLLVSACRLLADWSGHWGGERTLKKYRSVPSDVEGALLLLPSCPTMTHRKQMSEAIVSAIGVMMHAMRPAFPMFAVFV